MKTKFDRLKEEIDSFNNFTIKEIRKRAVKENPLLNHHREDFVTIDEIEERDSFIFCFSGLNFQQKVEVSANELLLKNIEWRQSIRL